MRYACALYTGSIANMDAEESWCRFFAVVASLLRDCERSTSTTDFNKIEGICERLERCVCNLQRLHSSALDAIAETNEGTQIERKLFQLLQQTSTVMLPYWRHKREASQMVPYQALTPGGPSLQRDSSQRGRPPYIISHEQIVYLRELQFTWKDIAKLLGVSRMTLYRKRLELGILDHNRCSLAFVISHFWAC